MTQIPMTNIQNLGYWNLVIGYYLELGIWLLEFEAGRITAMSPRKGQGG
jgi:hypothetical protein